MPCLTSQQLSQLFDSLEQEFKRSQNKEIIHSFLYSFTLKTLHPPSVHLCRCQGSSLSGQSFSAICLLYSSPKLFLMYSWLSSVRCSSNHVVVFTVLAHPSKKGLEPKDKKYADKRRHQAHSDMVTLRLIMDRLMKTTAQLTLHKRSDYRCFFDSNPNVEKLQSLRTFNTILSSWKIFRFTQIFPTRQRWKGDDFCLLSINVQPGVV